MSESRSSGSEASTENDGRLRATISQEPLREFVDGVNAVVDECRLHVEEDGLRVRAVDPANVATVQATLDADAFQSYDATEATLGFPFYRLQNVLDLLPNGPKAELGLNGTDTLRVSVGPYTHRLSLVDAEKLRSPPDDFSVDITAELTADRNTFFDAIEYFDEFASHVTFGFNSESGEFWMAGDGERGDDKGDFVLSEDSLAVEKDGDARAKYSLDFLRNFGRGSPEYGSVTLRTGNEVPMALRQKIAPEHLGPEDAVYRGELIYMLAPRITAEGREDL